MKQLMKQIEVRPMRSWLGACSLGLILSLSQMGVAQQTAAPAKAFTPVAFSALAPGASQAAAKPAGEEEEETAKPQKPGHEGLKVHGHWKIVAKNPDGSVAKTVEFENSLVPGTGDYLLASLLSGQATAGEWAIILNGTGLCAVRCEIANNITSPLDPLGAGCSSGIGYACSTPLTETITPFSNTQLTTLTFSGIFTAASGGSINFVATQSSYCIATAAVAVENGTAPYTPTAINFSPQVCQSTPPAGTALYTVGVQNFTSTSLTTAFGFTAGQLVQVTVNLSFS